MELTPKTFANLKYLPLSLKSTRKTKNANAKQDIPPTKRVKEVLHKFLLSGKI